MYDRVPMKFQARPTALRVLAFGLLKVTSYVRFLISYESSKNLIVAAFGLYVTTCANTPNMLSIYSKVFYGIIGFFILYSIMEIVEAITLSIFGGLSLTIFGVLNFILYVKNKESKGASKEYSTAATFVFIMVVIYTFITLVAAFGLYAAIFSKKYRMLKLYSIFGYIIVGLQVIISTSVIVSSIISNGGCANYSGENSTRGYTTNKRTRNSAQNKQVTQTTVNDLLVSKKNIQKNKTAQEDIVDYLAARTSISSQQDINSGRNNTIYNLLMKQIQAPDALSAAGTPIFRRLSAAGAH
ncbi:7073_t:CDS:10, partial [Rhizophagus irregularis]